MAKAKPDLCKAVKASEQDGLGPQPMMDGQAAADKEEISVGLHLTYTL